MRSDIDGIRGLCDSLEWLLVARGHRHTGRVTRSTLDRPTDGLVWTNKSTDGGLWADGPEAEIRLVLTHRRDVVHTLGGSPEWVFGAPGLVARKLLRVIAARGWAVQTIDTEYGVTVSRIESR
jgi:hypothetical protein